MADYYAAQFPDHVPRQRRRTSQMVTEEEETLLNDDEMHSPSRSTKRRIKRSSRGSGISDQVQRIFSWALRQQHYIWIFIALVVGIKLLSGRFSGPSSRNMRLSTSSPRSSDGRSARTVKLKNPLTLLFPRPIGRRRVFHPTSHLYDAALPHFSRLDFYSLRYLPQSKFFRYIHAEAYAWHEEEKFEQLADIDFPNLEIENEPFVDLNYPQPECHRLQWADDVHPTCNHFHELVVLDRDPTRDVLQSYQRRYLAHGYFRDAWLLEPAMNSTRIKHHKLPTMVLKTLRMERDFSVGTALTINKEALIMERMTSSPRIMNMYGHCFTSLLVEHGYEISQRIVQGVEYNGRGRIAQEVLDREEKDGVKPRNNFTVEEKLEIALAMAEGIAELHGNPEGLIINDDVHPDQWLIAADGSIKLNDCNNAHILNWNPKNNSYCKYVIWIGGDYRSPEELDGEPIDEKSDVWPLGANIFALLSGLYPHYTVNGTKLIEEIIANGTRPYLDPRYRERSMIEGGMYDIMEQCFEVDPEKRVDIFTVVQQLRGIQDSAIKERMNGDSPYRGDVILHELARGIVSAEKRKQRQKEAYFDLHGNLDGFEETTSYGDYGAADGDDDGATDDESGDDGD